MLDYGYFPPRIFAIYLLGLHRVCGLGLVSILFFQDPFIIQYFKFRSTSVCGRDLGSDVSRETFHFPHRTPMLG